MGAIDPLIRLISSNNPAIREQSLWALGNIAGEGAQERDLVLAKGIVPPLIRTMEAEGDFARNPSRPVSTLVKTAVWAMSNLCRNKNPLVNFNKVRDFLPIIMNVLHTQNNDVLGIIFFHVLASLHLSYRRKDARSV